MGNKLDNILLIVLILDLIALMAVFTVPALAPARLPVVLFTIIYSVAGISINELKGN